MKNLGMNLKKSSLKTDWGAMRTGLQMISSILTIPIKTESLKGLKLYQAQILTKEGA